MYKLSQVFPGELTLVEKERLSQLTSDPFAALVMDPTIQKEEEILLFSASLENTPVGLAVCSYNPVMKNAQLHTIFVSEPHRNKKIAQGLLKELGDALKKRHCRVVTKKYSAELSTKVQLEHALGNAGWQGTKLVTKRFWFDHPNFSPQWMKRSYPLPSGMTAFPWTELHSNERAVLWAGWKSWNIPAIVSPFWEEEKIVKEGSFGVRGPKGIIAWMITHQEAPDVRRYSSFYVRPEYRNTAIAIKILVDAIQYGIDQGIKWGVFDLHIQQTDAAWMKFVDLRLKPYAHHIEHTRQAWCLLS